MDHIKWWTDQGGVQCGNITTSCSCISWNHWFNRFPCTTLLPRYKIEPQKILLVTTRKFTSKTFFQDLKRERSLRFEIMMRANGKKKMTILCGVIASLLQSLQAVKEGNHSIVSRFDYCNSKYIWPNDLTDTNEDCKILNPCAIGVLNSKLYSVIPSANANISCSIPLHIHPSMLLFALNASFHITSLVCRCIFCM
jgi:hypothetical protein